MNILFLTKIFATGIANIEIPTPYHPIWIIPTRNDSKYEPLISKHFIDKLLISSLVFEEINPSVPQKIPNISPAINTHKIKFFKFNPFDKV